MGHQMGHAAFSSIRFTQFRVYMMLPEHVVYTIHSGLSTNGDVMLLSNHCLGSGAHICCAAGSLGRDEFEL